MTTVDLRDMPGLAYLAAALQRLGYSALVLAVFRAEAAGSFFAAVPGLPGSEARVQAGHGQRGLSRRTLRGQ
jgi:hypothetical protein